MCGPYRFLNNRDENRSARTTRHQPATEVVREAPSAPSSAHRGSQGRLHERTARRMASNRHLAVPPIAIRSRRVADPFDGLWDREMRPSLRRIPGLRPVVLLGVRMRLRHPDHDWDRLRRSLERRVRTWRAEHGADREVIFRQTMCRDSRWRVGFHRHGRCRRQHRRSDAGSSAVSLRAGLFSLGACRAGAGRREFHRASRWPAERPLVARRRAG